MGLDSFKGGVEDNRSGIKWSKDRLHKAHLCPHCGSSNTEKVKYYWRCKAKDCDIITYIHTGYNHE